MSLPWRVSLKWALLLIVAVVVCCEVYSSVRPERCHCFRGLQLAQSDFDYGFLQEHTWQAAGKWELGTGAQLQPLSEAEQEVLMRAQQSALLQMSGWLYAGSFAAHDDAQASEWYYCITAFRKQYPQYAAEDLELYRVRTGMRGVDSRQGCRAVMHAPSGCVYIFMSGRW